MPIRILFALRKIQFLSNRGNDLPPRHRSDKLEKNLAFLLENEPNFPNCEKRFVVNRIINADEVAVLNLPECGVPLYIFLSTEMRIV